MLRKARLKDARNIYKLISFYSKKGLLLPITLSEIYESIRDFTVCEERNEIVGCGALKIFTEDLAEIRSVAVKPEARGRGIGKRIVEFLIAEAKDMGLKKIFVLTTNRDFFTSCGFSEIDKSTLPHKVWKDCIKCPKFPECNEIAMIKKVEEK